MAKSKKVQMPIGIRNKLMAAVSMLLVSSIMMVSSTFAWFTLSTAPEVTGITTSVGANGNLEMALLNGVDGAAEGYIYTATDTFNDLSRITSAVGDSSSIKGSVVANTTWGNLVDLSSETYGLGSINLQPARLNVAADVPNKIAAVTNLLKTPIYGADGRVADLGGNTYTSGTYASGSWSYDSTRPTYGVRAIGANDNLTPQQAGLLAAKAAYNSNLNSAKATIQAALATNGSELASAITTLAMNSDGVTLTDGTVEGKGNQRQAISNMVSAAETALTKIDEAYKQVLLAATSAISDSTAYNAASHAVSTAENYNAAVTALQGLTELTGQNFQVPSVLATAASNLATQKSAVATAKAAITTTDKKPTIADSDYKAALNALVNTKQVTVNGYEVVDSNNDSANDLMVGDNINSTFMNKVIADGGAIVEMPDNSGVFAYVGSVAGNYSAGCNVSISYKGLVLNDMPATMKTTATVDTTVSGALNLIDVSGESTGATALSDTYGYALDFAFRTNASGSKLQLQTAAAQRVYSDGTSEVTQGSGSNMTFKSAVDTEHGGQPYLSDTQVAALMSAIRVAFINPTTGDIYGIAALDNITTSADGMKGDLVLKNYEIASETGIMTLTDKPSSNETEQKAKDDIMELPQNTATKLTAIVWLDGDKVDNGDVANAAQSLVGSMNLQFSSSEKLTPMKNTAMLNGTVNSAVPTASITGTNTIEGTGITTLTAKLSDNTAITSVDWSSGAAGVATVTPGENNTVTVTGVSNGTAMITATIHYGESKTATATYNVTVSGVSLVPNPD